MSEVLSCFDPAANPGGMLPVDESIQRILAQINSPASTEELSLASSIGCVLSEDLISDINVPQQRNSAMDGYAVAAEGLEPGVSLNVVGQVFAGGSYAGVLSKGEAVEIMTGAPVPEGADSILIREACTQSGKQLSFIGPVKLGQHVRQAGEDIHQGQVVLTEGTLLRAQELGLLASLGYEKLNVYTKPTVAVFSTGDEVVDQGMELPDNCIYDTNRFTLQGLLARLGCRVIDLGIVDDTQEKMEEALRKGAESADMVISSGGVSMGKADYIKSALDAIGDINFWKIAMRPGRPLAFGRLGNTPFFGLPGNPVAVMVTFTQFVQPALRKMMGQSDWQPLRMVAVAEERLKSRLNRTDYSRGVYRINETGQLVVSSTGMQGSGILTSMSKANCFIEIGNELAEVEEGECIIIQPFSDLI